MPFEPMMESSAVFATVMAVLTAHMSNEQIRRAAAELRQTYDVHPAVRIFLPDEPNGMTVERLFGRMADGLDRLAREREAEGRHPPSE